MATQDRYPPAGQYHAPPPPIPAHPQNGQAYGYHPAALPMPPREPPAPLQIVENQVMSPSSVPGSGGTLPAEPASHSMVEMGRRYRLDVMQQPQRARMCGFGDKDRRPITPPPCIRLVITDAVTGNEIDVNDIEHGLFVLNVDLWSADGLREVNLVRHSAASPSIPPSIPSTYPLSGDLSATSYINPLPVALGHPGLVRDPQYPYHNSVQAANGGPPGSAGYNSYPPAQQANPYAQYPQHGQPPQQQYGGPPHQAHQGYPTRPGSPPFVGGAPRYDGNHAYYQNGNPVHPIGGRPEDPQYQSPIDANMTRMSAMAGIGAPQGGGLFTRNLIGSLAASAFRLTDPNDKIGIWFVLQDLSVRTEGNFRLRFSFVNVGAPTKTPNGNPANVVSIVNTGKAHILASCFSDVFTVFSAKKFPGVVESTPLSKMFATQGIKIPIRRDGASSKEDEGKETY